MWVKQDRLNDTGSAILIFSAKESKNGIPHSRHFRDDLTDFCPVLRAGTKADLEKVFVGGVVGLMAASLLGELVGNFIGKGI